MNNELEMIGAREAAAIFHQPYGRFLEKVKKLKIPGAKLGKKWIFYKPDLLEYFRTLYAANEPIHLGTKLCQSSKTQKLHTIKSDSRSAVSECRKAREQLLNERRKSTKKSLSVI